MTAKLLELIEKAKRTPMTSSQLREQRRSFAFGNTHIENPRITRAMVDEADAEFEAKVAAAR